MGRTLAYWTERSVGPVLGAATVWFIYRSLNQDSALATGKYYDIIIKASSSLFGFLLTILALTINGTNSKVAEMKEHGSFPRLVQYHRVAVLLAFILVVYSVILFSIIETKNGTSAFIAKFGNFTYQAMVSLHAGICAWTAVDTLIFVILFYKIILAHYKNEF
jgi:hypothetical protein